MLDATLAQLDARGYWRDDGVYWAQLVEDIRALLVTSPVETEEEIPSKALSAAQIRDRLLGSTGDEDADAELNQKIVDTLSINSKGKVQKALENGYVLCSHRAHRGNPPASVPVRFVSGNPAIVETYNIQVHLDKAERATRNANDAIVTATGRVALLAPKKKQLLSRGQEQLALAMPLDQ